MNRLTMSLLLPYFAKAPEVEEVVHFDFDGPAVNHDRIAEIEWGFRQKKAWNYLFVSLGLFLHGVILSTVELWLSTSQLVVGLAAIITGLYFGAGIIVIGLAVDALIEDDDSRPFRLASFSEGNTADIKLVFQTPTPKTRAYLSRVRASGRSGFFLAEWKALVAETKTYWAEKDLIEGLRRYFPCGAHE